MSSTRISEVPGSDIDTSEVLEELLRDSLRTLSLVTLAVAWSWMASGLLFTKDHGDLAVTVFTAVLAAGALSYALQRRHLRLAIAAYLLGLTTAVTMIALVFPGVGALYLFTIILPITATLTTPNLTWAAAMSSAGAVMIIGLRHALPLADLLWPILSLFLTALTLWLNTRQVLNTLNWALGATAESLRNAAEARSRRAEVRSVLKSLEEATVRLQRANEALAFARAAADKAYRFKADFVANVSHELRTPLNLIVGFSEMMATAPESYRGVPLPSEYRGDMLAIYRSARHLSDLIDDVLDLSQIEVGRLPIHREPTGLGEIIREATEIVRGIAHAKGLDLNVDMPDNLPLLHLDRTRIRQVLLNLLSNAARFTDKGWIRVRVWLEGSETRVSVEDSGRGIAQDKITQAFQAFGQLSEEPARRGTGLGLALSKSFVELHGGMMWISSTVGLGTTVSFSLPLPDSMGTLPATFFRASARHPRQGDKPCVLVLHDDARVLNSLERYIEGYRFVLANTADKAMQMIREALPIAVILDNDWRECWLSITAKMQVPIRLAVLRCPLPSLRRAGSALGATDYLLKPVTREDLSAALARLPAEPRTVLVVDDDRHVVRLLVRMLTASRPALRVLEASGGREALDLIRTQQPDLVLLDLVMPDLSGYDLLVEMSHDATLARTQVVIMSAHMVEEEQATMPGDLQLARAGGFSLTEILQTVQALLGVVTQPAAVARASE